MLKCCLFVLLMFICLFILRSVETFVDRQRQNCSDEKTLCILCMGDSITQGYYGLNGIFYPYTMALRTALTRRYPDVYVRIFTRGRGGDMVHGKMRERLERELSREKFDLVIIMAGINDLIKLTLKDNEDLFEKLIDLHTLALDQGALRTVAMTLLPSEPGADKLKFITEDVFEVMRERTNTQIRSINSTDTSVCDTEQCFPLLLPGSYYWQPDHVHPSPLGYNMLGKCVFSCLVGEVEFLLDIKQLNQILGIV
eukprot:TCONS_00007518-protein